jgi:hypothetical protein
MLTPERIRELLDYDPDTGILTWRRRGIRPGCERPDGGWNTRFAGKKAGRPDKNGHWYVAISVDLYRTKNFAAHRLAWVLYYGAWPSQNIDHANGLPADNRIANLRLATQTQNMRNTRVRSDNTSGHKGVSWSAKSKKWYAYINANGRMIPLGKFRNREDAVTTRRQAAREYFGEFARED